MKITNIDPACENNEQMERQIVGQLLHYQNCKTFSKDVYKKNCIHPLTRCYLKHNVELEGALVFNILL